MQYLAGEINLSARLSWVCGVPSVSRVGACSMYLQKYKVTEHVPWMPTDAQRSLRRATVEHAWNM